MTLTSWLAWILTVSITGMVILLSTVGVVARLLRQRREARLAARTDRVRPLVLTALDGDVESANRQIAHLPLPVLASFDSLVVAMVPKLRGVERAALVRLLEDRGSIDAARGRTRSRLPGRRREAAEFLGAVGDQACAADVVLLLDDRAADVRLAAVRALGRIGAPSSLPALFARLDDAVRGRELPAHAVSMAAVRMGDAASEHLAELLASAGPHGREASASVLGWLGALPAVGALRASLTDESIAVVMAAASALGRMGVPDPATELIGLLGAHHPDQLRATSATALGRIGAPRAVPALRALLDDAPHTVAVAAAHALAALGEPGFVALAEAHEAGSPHARESRDVFRIRTESRAMPQITLVPDTAPQPPLATKPVMQ